MNESTDAMYCMSADSFTGSLTGSSPIDKVETSLDMAQALLISPFLNDSTMFSSDCISWVEMTFSPAGWPWEWFPVPSEFASAGAGSVFCTLG